MEKTTIKPTKKEILAKYPDLAMSGVWRTTRSRTGEFAFDRKRLEVSSHVYKLAAWLETLGKTATPKVSVGTLRNASEPLFGYCSEGEMILAALLASAPVSSMSGDSRVRVGVSKKGLKRQREPLKRVIRNWTALDVSVELEQNGLPFDLATSAIEASRRNMAKGKS